MSKRVLRPLLEAVYKLGVFVVLLSVFLAPLGPWWEMLPKSAQEVGRRLGETPEASAGTIVGTRVNTVEFFGGQDSGNQAGRNEGAQNNFQEEAFKLAETGADIIDAYIEVSVQMMAYAATVASTAGEVLLYFDACSPACTPSPAIVLDTTSVGTSDESMYGVFRASVSSEAQMAAYTGAGASLSFQIGYCIDDTNDSACSDGSPAPAHQAAKAKLVITYTYDATSPMLTNTAIYPVASDSDSPTNIGSRPSTLAACTMDTNCPKFYYNAEIPEIAMKAASRSQFFYMQTSLNAATTTDSQFTAQVDGATTGPVHWYEEARSGNGNWISYFIASNSSTLGVNGYQNNVAQKLEIRNTGATTMGVIGGEDYVTYTYPANAAVKTKTVVYPVGEVCTTGCTVLGALTGPTVYFPEEGVVVKKAWFRVHTSTASTTTANLDVVTKVGANAQTASVAYALISDAIGTNQGGYLIHVIPSADYTEMALATGSVGKAVQMRADWSATTRGAISAELVITYQYTSDAGGYMQTETLVAGQQRGTASTSFTSGIVDPAFPEASGAKIIRGVSVRTTLLDTNATADGTVGSNLEIVGTTCSANSSATSTPDMAADLGNLIHFKDLTSKMKTSDATTYKVCYKGSQASIFGGTITITYQVNLPKYIQSAYRIFTNDNAVTVTTALANQDTSATLTSDGQIFRLRLLLDVASGSLAINGDTFKLQAAKRSGTCDTAFSGETYTDISTNTSISYDTTNSPANAADLTTNPSLDPEHGSVATKSQDYMEANNFTNSVSAISSVSQAGLWDFALKDNDVDGSDTFCLRAVRSDGTPFTTGGGTYLVITQITGYGLAPFSQNDYEWFFNADSVQPGSAIQGAENTAATIGSAGVLARLRMNLTVETSDLTVGGGGDWCSVTNYCNSSWLNRRKITFNNTASSENLTNFPVLITLKTASSSVDYSKILANGADIRFIDSDGASLSYEIEKWDEANTTYIWVKVPQIDLGSTTDYIYMYYNNTGASDFQRPSNVWSNSYVIVNHMAQNPGGGAPQMTESSNGRNGTSSGTMTSGDLVAAKVGDGIDFDGTDDRIDMSNASYIDSLGTMSMCAWVNVALPTDRTGYFNVIDKSTNTTDGSSLYLGDNVGNGSGYVINRSTSQTYVEKINSVLPNVWTYFCGAWGGGSTINTYVNGAVQTSYDFTQAGSGTHQNGSTTLYFGSDGGKSNNVIGIIDEVQISSVARSAEWIEASYNWTFKPWNYNTFASEDTYAPSGGNQQFTLQYSTSTGGPWTDVGTGAWAFYNNTGVTDGATLGSALVSTTEVLQTYQESNPSPVNVNSATVGQDIEYDWSLDPANALSTTYYFRMVDASGTALTSYDVNYPAITIGTQNPGTNPNNGGGGGGSGGGAGGGTPISGGGDGGGDGGGGDGGGSGQGGGGGGGGGGGSPMLYDIWFIFDSFLNAPLRDSINSTWQ